MLRGFLFHLIPVLVPFVVYGIYLYFMKRNGGEGTWKGRSTAIVTIIGLLMMAISFIVLWAVQDQPRDGKYIPPRYEDGKLIAPQIIPENKD